MHIFICDVPRCDACLKMLMTSKLKATGTSKNVFHLMLMVAIEATEVQRTSHDINVQILESKTISKDY